MAKTFLRAAWCLLACLAGLLCPAGAGAEDGLLQSITQGKLQLNLRNFYMDRSFNGGAHQSAWAIGGEFAYATKPWYGVSVGGSFYTSQPFFYAPTSRPGTTLLDDSQNGYSVLGQAFIKLSHSGFSATLGRQIIDTPFLNPYDVRMTPVTFEALTMGYAQGGLSLTLGQVTGIKTWNDTTFQPMSQAAGIAGTDEAVTMAGASYKWGAYQVQLWNYYCHQFMNVVFFQADANWKLTGDWSLAASAQAMDQRDIGDAINGTFHAFQAGVQAALTWRKTTLTLAYTDTSDDHDMVNPWGGWPGYTSIMELDNDLAGQRTWLVTLSADLAQYGLKGFQASVTHTRATVPSGDTFATPDQLETDADLSYYFQGALKPLWIRLRAAYVDQDINIGGDTYTDFRVILNYDFSL